MKTIALRFGEHFSPDCGTISAHEEIIKRQGYVWYGKMGTPVSQKAIDNIMSMDNPKILLIRSGKPERYWAYIKEINTTIPEDTENIPSYYRNTTEKFKTWFKVESFEEAPKDIMKNFVVSSSKQLLSDVSKHSMSPYFMIETF